jgi:hypothetical protein
LLQAPHSPLADTIIVITTITTTPKNRSLKLGEARGMAPEFKTSELCLSSFGRIGFSR